MLFHIISRALQRVAHSSLGLGCPFRISNAMDLLNNLFPNVGPALLVRFPLNTDLTLLQHKLTFIVIIGRPTLKSPSLTLSFAINASPT